jgi:predicted Holliday junction resolvase-like endonuclease
MKRTFLTDLTDFFRAARHLWGRCPHCEKLFRLSDVAISFGSEPPHDWLRRLQKERKELDQKLEEINEREDSLNTREYEVESLKRELNKRESNQNREVKRQAAEYLKGTKSIKQLVQESSNSAVLNSRSVLLGKLYERLAPFLRGFKHDPRDIRPILDPIDYVCFDGLTVNRRVSRITFVEVKTGTSKVTDSQKSIEEAVKDHRVGMEVLRIGSKDLSLHQQLQLSRDGRD